MIGHIFPSYLKSMVHTRTVHAPRTCETDSKGASHESAAVISDEGSYLLHGNGRGSHAVLTSQGDVAFPELPVISLYGQI